MGNMRPLESVSVSSFEEATSAVEQRSFEEFFDEEHARLYRALCMVVGSRDEADDVAQEAFLKVWRRWGRVSEMESPSSYLFRIAMNVSRSRYRSAMRALRVAISAPAADAYAEIDDRDMVFRALGALTPRQRAAVVLTNLVGYSSEEAGRMLSMKASTVRTLSTRARAELRETVGEDR